MNKCTVTLLLFVMSAAGLLAGSPAVAGEDNVRFEDGKMYVDGKPFLYWGPIWQDGNSFETLKQYRFNACSGRPDRPVLDHAAEAGLHLMVGLRGYDPPAEWLVKHPAMLAWFLMDDAAGEEHLKIIQDKVAAIRQTDQTHPALADIIGALDDQKKFMEVLNIYAPYHYPLPEDGYWYYFHDWLDGHRDTTGHKYLWTAFQCSGIYSFHARKGYTWSDQLQYPAPGQFRLLCWGAMAHGVRGFMFWPIQGLLPANNDIGDRTAEAVIMSHELEIIGEEIVAGDDVRDGAHCARDDIDVGRIDLHDHTILIASVIRDNYQYAMDEAVANVEITLPRPPQLDGELRAYNFGFPQIEQVELRQEGDQLIVGPHNIEITDVIVIEEAGACQPQHTTQIKQHLPAVAAAAQSLLRYLDAKMEYVNHHLVDLNVDVPRARKCFAKAVQLKDQSAEEFNNSRFATSFRSARAAQRNYRQMLWEYREYALQFREYASVEMQLYLMMPYELPRYFASFDHTAVGEK